jgi:hypothetical protein
VNIKVLKQQVNGVQFCFWQPSSFSAIGLSEQLFLKFSEENLARNIFMPGVIARLKI